MGNIKTINIVKEFGEKQNKVRVLDDINIEIKDGEFVSLMGPSGSGKSTLLYLIGGLDKPTSGKVMINDKDISKLSDTEMSKLRRRDIGFVFQFYNLVQNLTVEENIMLPVVMNGEKESSYKERLQSREILEDGRKMKQNRDDWRLRMEKIKQQKIQDLKNLGVQQKYIADLEKYKIV